MRQHLAAQNTATSERPLSYFPSPRLLWPLLLYPPASGSDAPTVAYQAQPPPSPSQRITCTPRQVSHCPHLRSSPVTTVRCPHLYHREGEFTSRGCHENNRISGRHVLQTALLRGPSVLLLVQGQLGSHKGSQSVTQTCTHALFPSQATVSSSASVFSSVRWH